MEAHIVEGAVVQAVLVLLHLGLDPTDAPLPALLAPVAVLPPVHAGTLQHGVAAAAELDVVGRRVVAKQPLVGLHPQLEGDEAAGGAVHGVGPLAKAGDEEEEDRRGRSISPWENLVQRNLGNGFCCLWTQKLRSEAFRSYEWR